jgi:glyoxylase-like metal-dependent hydrolase (beta-lactamase superfamily II)
VIEIPGHDAVGIRADNPGPFTLTGTNTWIVGRDPAWVIDPGPALEEHVAAVAAEIERRGGLGGVALTHDHHDHKEAAPDLIAKHTGSILAGARGEVDVRLADGISAGPFEALATPGHAPDHFTLLAAGLAFTGDAVLGTGSVFIYPDPGALAGYLAGLERLRARAPQLICPGHGPLVPDPDAKIAEYIGHRLERERNLLSALENGLRTVDALLDAVWSDAPAMLRPAAAVTLAAHLDKLEEEGRLPGGVERPPLWQ